MMIVDNGPITHEKVLVVEGKTPLHLFDALTKKLGLKDLIEICDFGGIKDLRRFLKVLVVTPGFKERVTSLGIARDAETDPDGAKQSVNSALENAQLGDSVTVSIAILPDQESTGNIESLCIRSVKDEVVYECVTQFFDCVRGKNITLPVGPAFEKHVAQVYMATKDYPQMFPGQAAYKDVWPLMGEAFGSLREFLSNL